MTFFDFPTYSNNDNAKTLSARYCSVDAKAIHRRRKKSGIVRHKDSKDMRNIRKRGNGGKFMYNERFGQYDGLRRRVPGVSHSVMTNAAAIGDFSPADNRNRMSNPENRDVRMSNPESREARMQNLENSCGCEGKNKGCSSLGWGLYEYPLAMAYAPYQIWRNIYKEDTALSRGTMFSELDLPFEGSDCNCRKG